MRRVFRILPLFTRSLRSVESQGGVMQCEDGTSIMSLTGSKLEFSNDVWVRPSSLGLEPLGVIRPTSKRLDY